MQRARPYVHVVLSLTILLGWGVRLAEASDLPEPDFDRVDHTNPNAHLALSAHMGNAAKIRSIAAQLKKDDARETLVAIHRWMDRNLRCKEDKAYAWRTFDRMLEDRCYGSCADHAAMFGTLARAAGIPAVWVKTMDVDWIRRFKRGDRQAKETYVGHVFLEVWLGGRWRLLDAQGMRLWADYAPRSRVLPGQRFAYDKGDDPYELVLSCRWEDWKKQTDRHFAAFDLAQIPWSRSEDLLAPWRLHIVGSSASARSIRSVASRLGFQRGMSFDRNHDRWLPQCRGSVVLVLSENGRPMLPEAYWDAWLPPAPLEALRKGRPLGAGWASHRLPDGTRVIWVRNEPGAKGEAMIAQALGAESR